MAGETRPPDPTTPLAIAEGLDVLLVSENEALIQFGTRSRPSNLLRDDELTGMLGAVLGRLLVSSASLEELTAGVASERVPQARALIADLLEAGILTEASRSPVEQFLAYTFTGSTSLRDRRVGVVGSGPLGARLAHGLLQHGVGGVTVLDGRPANRRWLDSLPAGLHRASEADVAAGDGRPAHMALRDLLVGAGFPDVEAMDGALDTAGLGRMIASSDLTVVAFERQNLLVAHLINRLCLRGRQPWILATIDGNRGIVGPLFLPPKTACYNCYRVLADAATPSREMARAYRRHLLRSPLVSTLPGLPAYADIVSGYACLAVVHALLGASTFALGRVVVIDFSQMEIDCEDVLKLPRCPVCGAEKSAYRAPFPPEVVSET